MGEGSTRAVFDIKEEGGLLVENRGEGGGMETGSGAVVRDPERGGRKSPLLKSAHTN